MLYQYIIKTTPFQLKISHYKKAPMFVLLFARNNLNVSRSTIRTMTKSRGLVKCIIITFKINRHFLSYIQKINVIFFINITPLLLPKDYIDPLLSQKNVLHINKKVHYYTKRSHSAMLNFDIIFYKIQYYFFYKKIILYFIKNFIQWKWKNIYSEL